MEMIQSIHPTSITSLKMQCLLAAGGDIDEARKIYDFFADGMEGLPVTDPIPPTFIDNAKNTMNGLLGWIRDNKDTIEQGIDLIRGAIPKKSPLKPIN